MTFDDNSGPLGNWVLITNIQPTRNLEGVEYYLGKKAKQEERERVGRVLPERTMERD